MISETFSFAEPLIVDHWLDHLLTPHDQKYGRGTLQDSVIHSVMLQSGHIARKIIMRDGRYVPGLSVDHINSDRTDNRRANLQMITQAENLRKRRNWRSMPHLYEPAEREPGIRVYPFSFDIEVDDDNADMLDIMYRKYTTGKLHYGVAHSLYSAGVKTSNLHVQVLKANGVIVPKGMPIHHKNDNPFDNRFANLEVLTRSEHAKRHQ